MKIRIGYELAFDCPQPTPVILMLNVHASRARDLAVPDRVVAVPSIPIRHYVDGYGNQCTRIVAPRGMLHLSTDAVITDSGLPDVVNPAARQTPVDQLPDEALLYLLGSRYCETEPLTDFAWQQFSHPATGWSRVQAICDYVHHHIEFGYHHARSTRTAWEAYQEKKGVCRDYAHLAIALCRCMNIPARYCAGYLSDIAIPPPYGEMDFAAWFEAFLDGAWYIFDPRNNMPRIGRIPIARGRDAADVAISTTFGRSTLRSFKVHTDEMREIPTP
ncbi:transglutaminase-like domain-containing protein [Isoalcanivorax indicus]|uniref:transglutaminase-like domain-containing protein n=1 Tax=Isoalcanivorax indicus TaxID=2202653 RepID=UPI000DBA5E62|nr:transglutaminase family protein [Isoalcanivorax indicus]